MADPPRARLLFRITTESGEVLLEQTVYHADAVLLGMRARELADASGRTYYVEVCDPEGDISEPNVWRRVLRVTP
jgi:hypothetical protein